MTSTLPSVQEQYADSHTSAAGASSWAMVNSSVSNTKLKDHQHWSQLNTLTFQPVMAVQVDKLDQLLIDHPNWPIVNYVVQGFLHGFSLKYQGPRQNCQPKNLPTAFTNSKELQDSIMKEMQLCQMTGSFQVQPLYPLICSPVGMVPKKNSTAMRCITHLSYPLGRSVNS